MYHRFRPKILTVNKKVMKKFKNKCSKIVINKNYNFKFKTGEKISH